MAHTVLLIGPFKNGAQHFLKGYGHDFEVSHVITAKEGLTFIERENRNSCITVLLDMHVEDEDGFDVLGMIKSKHPIIEVIAISPEYRAVWAIETMRLGGYAFETYSTNFVVIMRYLAQITEQLNVFKIAETVCRDKMIKEMDIRLNLAMEFLIRRRFEGYKLTEDELSVFFPITDADDSSQSLHRHLQNLDFGKSARILLVEDDPGVSETLYSILVGLLQHDVTIVDRIAKANELIEQDKGFHIAILDIGMPDGRGTDLIRPILTQSPATEVIMLTAYDDAFHIMTSFHHGASDYVPKPFSTNHLQQVVAKAAQRYVCKSFLPLSSWKPVALDNDRLGLRLALFEELIAIRQRKKKPIHTRELGVFLPSFCGISTNSLEWISPDSFKNGVASFLLSFAQDHQLKVSEEERTLLGKE